MPHPCQPTIGAGGNTRFRANPIVASLFKDHPDSLELVLTKDFPSDDLSQFLQLLGQPVTELQKRGWVDEDKLQRYSRTGGERQPLQPLTEARDGMIRFRSNSVIAYLLDSGPIDMNELATRGFKRSDREQFAQLIGYSHSGACELSYMSEEALDESWREWEGRQSRILAAHMTETLPPGMANTNTSPRL